MALLEIVMQIHVERTQEFSEWFEGLNLKDQLQIDSRIQRIRDHFAFWRCEKSRRWSC
jgi:hypothetical protein